VVKKLAAFLAKFIPDLKKLLTKLAVFPKNPAGFILPPAARPPLSLTSKWRCGPVELPAPGAPLRPPDFAISCFN